MGWSISCYHCSPRGIYLHTGHPNQPISHLPCIQTQTTSCKRRIALSLMRIYTTRSSPYHQWPWRISRWQNNWFTAPQLQMAIPCLLARLWPSTRLVDRYFQTIKLWSTQSLVWVWWWQAGLEVAFPSLVFDIIFCLRGFDAPPSPCCCQIIISIFVSFLLLI
jgi:hypothetical protein